MDLKTHLCLTMFISTLGCPSGMQEDEYEHQHHNHSSEAIPESILGNQASGELYTVEIITAEPDPASKGKNDWTISVTDSNNVAVSDATLTVVPFMSVHGHGTSPSSFTANQGDQAGEYIFTELNFIMSGAWEMTFTISVKEETDAGTTTDTIVMSIVVAN
tara:strand:- start:60 stop:542 length:483 start_codon:yes stop_codon:yes gene_type:complete